MPRTLLTLLIAIPTLWLAIQVFGAIVSGDIALAGWRVNRERTAVKFWVWIAFLGALCCGLLLVALGFFLNYF